MKRDEGDVVARPPSASNVGTSAASDLNPSKDTSPKAMGNRVLPPVVVDEKSKPPEADGCRDSRSSSISSGNGENSQERCAICLSVPKNRSCTDTCFHEFCFICLLEWSKIKPLCPLCKSHFRYIIHNIRAMDDYEQYAVPQCPEPPSIQTVPRNFFMHNAPFLDFQFRIASSLRLYDGMDRIRCFHQRRFPSVQHSQSTSEFRRMIYQRHLRVLPLNCNRVRVVSAFFFQENPACIHRLVPWLNRELNVLLDGHASRVQFLIRLLCHLVKRYEITSSTFRLRILNYLQIYTDHFIHEFYNFARSPYDMEEYDRVARYDGGDAADTAFHERPTSDVTVVRSSAPVHALADCHEAYRNPSPPSSHSHESHMFRPVRRSRSWLRNFVHGTEAGTDESDDQETVTTRSGHAYHRQSSYPSSTIRSRLLARQQERSKMVNSLSARKSQSRTLSSSSDSDHPTCSKQSRWGHRHWDRHKKHNNPPVVDACSSESSDESSVHSRARSSSSSIHCTFVSTRSNSTPSVRRKRSPETIVVNDWSAGPSSPVLSWMDAGRNGAVRFLSELKAHEDSRNPVMIQTPLLTISEGSGAAAPIANCCLCDDDYKGKIGSDSSDVEVVAVLKSNNLRTPEIITISDSDSDSDFDPNVPGPSWKIPCKKEHSENLSVSHDRLTLDAKPALLSPSPSTTIKSVVIRAQHDEKRSVANESRPMSNDESSDEYKHEEFRDDQLFHGCRTESESFTDCQQPSAPPDSLLALSEKNDRKRFCKDFT